MNAEHITADALAIQERDRFRADGWVKLVAPAKVNLFLGIGARRADGYHDAHTVMHALALHDVVYMRKKNPMDDTYESNIPQVQLVSCRDIEVPSITSDDNLASKAIKQLEASLAGNAPENFCDIVVRIEKNIPFQGGLGGASTDAAAALIGAATLNQVDAQSALLEETACSLGADVPFFLRGGCAYYEGTGGTFVHTLEASSCALVLIKPEGGVSTAEAYRTFDEHPAPVDQALLQAAASATCAQDVPIFNNLVPAVEMLMPALANIRVWASEQPGVRAVQLCGSGATTFAICEHAAAALSIVTAARSMGWWARATSFCPLSATVIKQAAL